MAIYSRSYPYRILIIGGSGSRKTNALLNLIENQLDIDKIYLYVKDPYEAKYQCLMNIRKSAGLNHFNDPKVFIEYSNDMQDLYNDPKAFNEYSNDIQNEFNIKYSNDMQDVYKDTNEKRKILIFFHDMIADMINDKKLNSIVTELFIRGRKLNISFAFIVLSYFKVSKDVRLNTTHFFIIKITNKEELQQMALNHSSDINTKDFINIYKKYTGKPYSFLVNDATLPSDNPLRFRKNIFNI